MTLIQRLNLRGRVLRAIIYAPILELLIAAGITANQITNIRLVLGVIFLWLAWQNPLWGASLLLFILWLDTLDGAIARKTKTTSDKGKFLDVVADMIIYGLNLTALFFYPISRFWIILNLLTVPVAYLLHIVYHNEKKPSDWIIHSEVHLAHIKTIVVLTYFFYIISGANYLNEALKLSTILAIGWAGYYWVALQWRWRENK